MFPFVSDPISSCAECVRTATSALQAWARSVHRGPRAEPPPHALRATLPMPAGRAASRRRSRSRSRRTRVPDASAARQQQSAVRGLDEGAPFERHQFLEIHRLRGSSRRDVGCRGDERRPQTSRLHLSADSAARRSRSLVRIRRSRRAKMSSDSTSATQSSAKPVGPVAPANRTIVPHAALAALEGVAERADEFVVAVEQLHAAHFAERPAGFPRSPRSAARRSALRAASACISPDRNLRRAQAARRPTHRGSVDPSARIRWCRLAVS